MNYADIEDLRDLVDFKPKVNVNDGVREFVRWYLKFYRNAK